MINQTPTYQIALSAVKASISVVPIRPDGTKQPAVTGWREYQRRLPTAGEVQTWFANAYRGLALVTGQVSGGLIALDFDDPVAFDAWLKRVKRDTSLNELYEYVSSGYEERTPKGGRHILFRCPEAFAVPQLPGNRKLALRPVPPPPRTQTLAETREEGGLIIVDPTRGSVHPSGKPYVRLRGGVTTIRTITAKQREQLYASVQALDETRRVRQGGHPVETRQISPCPRAIDRSKRERPGDLFNQSATWEEVLIPHGWQLVRMESAEGYWCRPGKTSGISATTNHDSHDLLYVFSSSTVFEAERGYTKFAAYTTLNHNGDFAAAARALVEMGYSTRRKHREDR